MCVTEKTMLLAEIGTKIRYNEPNMKAIISMQLPMVVVSLGLLKHCLSWKVGLHQEDQEAFLHVMEQRVYLDLINLVVVRCGLIY